MQTENLYEKFNHIHNVIATPKFLKMEALGGEIPFWISAYNPTQEIEIVSETHTLERRLGSEGVSILNIDLFVLSMEIIEQYVGIDGLLLVEEKKKKETFKRALQSTINIRERLIPAIRQRVDDFNPAVLFITGVGKVYPFIRSHNVLNNLQSAIKDIPTLMFFPGRYTGQSLDLFGLLRDDNYYRAFNIDNYKL